MKYIEEDKRIYALDGQVEAGEITFSKAGDSILIIDHTFVDENYRGQGIAEELVKEAVEKAKRDNKKIIPLCPFAAKEFANNKNYKEVLHQ